jgi:replicative DNA helicase
MSEKAEALLYNQEAEQSTLGALLIDPGAIPRVTGALQPGDFWLERHNWVYEALLALRRAGSPVDFVTLCDELERQELLEKLGGAAYVTKLLTTTPTSMHVEHYASIVSRLATSRKLVQVATRIAQLAYDQSNEIDGVFAQARSLIDSVAPLDLGRAILTWEDSLDWYLESQEERIREVKAEKAGEVAGRVRFPWRALRRRVRFIRPGIMVLVGSDSGIGKTTFLECCAERWAQGGHRVVFFHFELSHQIMQDRKMCRQAGIPMADLEEGTLDERMTRASAAMYAWPGGIDYVHCPGWPMSRVVGTARRLAAKGRCHVVIVDYLQKALLPPKTQGLTPAQVRGQQVEALKTLGEQLGIPTVLATQLNRSAQQYGRKTRYSIRDTGEADEKANIVLLLDRDVLDTGMEVEYAFDENTMASVTARQGEMSLAMKVRTDKNTLGATGDDELLIDPSRFWIMDDGDGTRGAVGWEERAAGMEAL